MVRLQPFKGLGVAFADEGGTLRLLGESPELLFRKVGRLVLAEGDIEAPLLVVATEAVIAVSIQVQEQGRALARLVTLVKSGTQLKIGLALIIRRAEQPRACWITASGALLSKL